MLGEAQNHGRSTTGVSVAFGKGDDVCTGDLTKRNQNSVLLKLELFFKSYMAKVMLGLHVIYFMVAQRYHSKICTILRRKNKK